MKKELNKKKMQNLKQISYKEVTIMYLNYISNTLWINLSDKEGEKYLKQVKKLSKVDFENLLEVLDKFKDKGSSKGYLIKDFPAADEIKEIFNKYGIEI